LKIQFMIFIELIGTVILPAAITFTFILIIMTILHVGDTLVPMILLAVILGLPAVLIVLISGKIIYVFWMIIYLLSLPIWNFVLPLYAFWHFDDFSWGETRLVAGETKQLDHSRREGEFDGKGINMKRWSEWVQLRKIEHYQNEIEKRRQTFFGGGSVSGYSPSRESLAIPYRLSMVSEVSSNINPYWGLPNRPPSQQPVYIQHPRSQQYRMSTMNNNPIYLPSHFQGSPLQQGFRPGPPPAGFRPGPPPGFHPAPRPNFFGNPEGLPRGVLSGGGGPPAAGIRASVFFQSPMVQSPALLSPPKPAQKHDSYITAASSAESDTQSVLSETSHYNLNEE
jgi:hypothetical protein